MRARVCAIHLHCSNRRALLARRSPLCPLPACIRPLLYCKASICLSSQDGALAQGWLRFNLRDPCLGLSPLLSRLLPRTVVQQQVTVQSCPAAKEAAQGGPMCYTQQVTFFFSRSARTIK